MKQRTRKTNMEINDRVQRLDGGYTKGKLGTVVEIDDKAGRARVFWDGDKRTWVRFASLAIIPSPFSRQVGCAPRFAAEVRAAAPELLEALRGLLPHVHAERESIRGDAEDSDDPEFQDALDEIDKQIENAERLIEAAEGGMEAPC